MTDFGLLDALIYGYRTVKSAGVALVSRSVLNFGAGFVLTDNPATETTDISVSGVNAFSVTTASFVQPAVSGTVSVAVDSTAWIAVGQPVYVSTGGQYTVASIDDSTHVTLTNLGTTGNAAPTVTVATAQALSPSGVAGVSGTDGAPSGWLTIADWDLSLEANQNIIADGAHTIGAFSVTTAGSANVTSSDVVNGSGIVIVGATGVAITYSVLASLASLAPAYVEPNPGEELEFSFYVTHSTLTATGGESVIARVNDGGTIGTDERTRLAKTYLTGTLQWEFGYYTPSSGAYTNVRLGDLSNTADDVWIHRLKNATTFEVHSSLYAAGFGRPDSWHGGLTIPANTLASGTMKTWLNRGRVPSVDVTYVAPSSNLVAKTITIRRIRIRVRPLV